MEKPLCIYHGNCADGYTAAWVVRKFFGPGGAEFHPGGSTALLRQTLQGVTSF